MTMCTLVQNAVYAQLCGVCRAVSVHCAPTRAVVLQRPGRPRLPSTQADARAALATVHVVISLSLSLSLSLSRSLVLSLL